MLILGLKGIMRMLNASIFKKNSKNIICKCASTAGINILLNGILLRRGRRWEKVHEDFFGLFFQTIQRLSKTTVKNTGSPINCMDYS